MTQNARDDTVSHREQPYKDVELLRELYLEEEMSLLKIGEKLDCSPNTVKKYLKEDGVEIRGRYPAMKLGRGRRPNEVAFGTHKNGPEVWWPGSKDTEKKHVFVHRLVAVAEYGFDAVADAHIHHKNEIRWDNRPENLVPMDPGDHATHHCRKVDEETRKEIAYRYERTDDSSYQVAEDYPISATTVRAIHEEYYGNENGGEKAV